MKVIQLFKNEKQLIRRAAKNQREAQQKLFELHSGKMLSVCRQYIKDLQHAEEVMLNGFYKAFTHLSSYKGEGSFEGWLRKIMIREAISFLRTYRKIDFHDEILVVAPGSNNIDEQYEVAYIQQIIDELPEGYKMVFMLYAIEGYRHQEISEMLSISEGTSKSQLFKARKMLQDKLTSKRKEYGSK